jgi:hypothetical protein
MLVLYYHYLHLTVMLAAYKMIKQSGNMYNTVYILKHHIM